MTTQQIAERLVELLGQGQFETAQKELLAEDAVSTEPDYATGVDKPTHGLENIIGKGHQFTQMIEAVHGITVSEPLVSGNSFACVLTMDVTMKGQGRSTMSELSLYRVKDGKVVSEQFFM